METKTVYKIRRKSDGLFSSGGNWPSFSKKGKEWKQQGHLTNSLNQARRDLYQDCELVTITYIAQETSVRPLDDYYSEMQERKLEREAQEQAIKDAAEKAKRQELYNQLKKEFE